VPPPTSAAPPPAPALPPVNAVVPAAKAAAPSSLDLDRASLRGDRLVVPSPEGEAMLTLVPRMQQHVAELLKRYDVPQGAFAAIEPATGRVLALASFSAIDPKAKPFALRSVAPAASIFKLVTAGSLLDQSALDPQETVCFRGGKRRLYKENLQDSRRDGRCTNLSRAVAWSLNAPIAKMALKHLTPAALVAAAEGFGFNIKIPFEVELEPSSAKIPTDMVGFGRAAAGFGDVRLSALHAALLSGAVANGGQLLRPYVVEEVHDAKGALLRRGEPEVLSIALSPPIAKRVGNMMLLATTEGTGRRHLQRGRSRHLGEILVPGKTGSLAVHDPFMDYSWFVGYAPAEDPKVAFAAVVGNKPLWHIKSGYVAIEGLRKFFKVESTRHRPPRASGPRRRRHRG
jgi:cell division protein FtsI/penicillin-binding protein 2